MSAIAEWIRENTRKRRESLLEQGRRQGREEALREIYGPDYTEPPEGHPHRSEGNDEANGRKANGV